jgi:hypothetical protein
MVLNCTRFVEWGGGEISQCTITDKCDCYFPVTPVTFVRKQVDIMIAWHNKLLCDSESQHNIMSVTPCTWIKQQWETTPLSSATVIQHVFSIPQTSQLIIYHICHLLCNATSRHITKCSVHYVSLPVTQQHQQVAVVHHENSLFHFPKIFVYFVPYFTLFLSFYSAAELVTLQGDNWHPHCVLKSIQVLLN